MPHGDRTGPMGQGSKTGRAMGYCSGSDSPGSMAGATAGAGWSAGRRFGRGMNRNAVQGASWGFGRRGTPGFRKRGGLAARGKYPGYNYTSTAQTGDESGIDFLENRVKSLKQELDNLMVNLKELRSRENDEKE